MPRTTTEAQISRSRTGSGVLIPMLEQRLRKSVKIVDDEDAAFIHDLAMKQAEREKERDTENRFSPSALASCLRLVYLKRNYKKFDMVKVAGTRIEPNFYFLTGDWLHIKWQFVLHRMSRENVEGFKLLGVEIPVVSKRGDHGGTLDAAVELWGTPMGLDFKGLNVRDFGRATRGDISLDYRIQLADYLILANSDRTLKLPRMEKGLIVVENKGGPEPKRPIALTEIEVSIADHKAEIKWRLEELRRHEKENSIPDPECRSPYSIQFTGCPFRKFCEKEVKAIYKQARDIEAEHSKELQLNVPDPKRSNHARRNTRRGRKRTA